MSELKAIDEFPFEFYGTHFSAILASNRKLYLPLGNLCTTLGIDTNAQVQRINRDEAISDALVLLPLELPYGDEGATQVRQIRCLCLNQLPYWLGTIDTQRIKDTDRRAQIISFKREFVNVAWAAFRSQILPEDIRAEMDATLPPAEQAYYATMDEAAAIRQEVKSQADQLESVETRLDNLEARLLGTDFITPAQAKHYLDMVAIIGAILRKRKTGDFEHVHAEVKRTFQVPSYRLIPEDQFPRLVAFLTQWYEKLTPPGTPLPVIFTRPTQGRLL